MKYIQRRLEAQVLGALRRFPALVLTGPRRAGKTWMLRRRPRSCASPRRCGRRPPHACGSSGIWSTSRRGYRRGRPRWPQGYRPSRGPSFLGLETETTREAPAARPAAGHPGARVMVPARGGAGARRTGGEQPGHERAGRATPRQAGSPRRERALDVLFEDADRHRAVQEDDVVEPAHVERRAEPRARPFAQIADPAAPQLVGERLPG